MASLLQELKRRHVFKVVASYAVVAWLLIQVAVSVEAPLGLPDWVDTFVIVALVIGFPVCALLAWFYDLKGLAVERTADAAEAAEAPGGRAGPLSGRDRIMAGLAAAAAVLLVSTAAYLLVDRGEPAYDSVAFLPFVNARGDESVDYLANGIRDGLATRLSRLDQINVKLGTTAAAAPLDPRALGEALQARAICTGRFEQNGDTIELVTELFDTRDGSLIWRDEFSTESTGLIAIESAIARELPARLGLQPTEAQMADVLRTRTTNPAAHRLYLQGRYFWNRRSRDGFIESIDRYSRAIEIDPNFALAYSGLADAYLMLLGWGLERPDVVAPLVDMYATQAIQRDPTLAEPHATLGYLRTIYDLDWEAARERFLRAIELNGQYPSAHHWYAFLLMTEGNMSAAIEEILLARQTEPMSPIINAEVGYFLLYDRQYERGVAELEAASLLDPNYPSTLNYLLWGYAALGRTEEAIAIFERSRPILANDLANRAFGALGLPLLGMEAEAREVYEDVIAASRQDYVMPAILGILAGAVGDNDAAFDYFDAAIATNSLVASWLRDPRLDGLRRDPRYAMLFRRIGLEP